MKCSQCRHFSGIDCVHVTCFERHFKFEVDYCDVRVRNCKDKMTKEGYCKDYREE